MKKTHFIGICGIGMSAVAKLLKDAGWEVSGSDEAFYPPASTYLKDNDMPFVAGYKAENIPQDADLIVIGKNAKLTREGNPEVQAAFESGKTIRSYPEIIGSLFSETENIVVTGSYGKSTCTALLAHILEHNGKDPGYFIGAIPLPSKKTARLPEKKIGVLEGDEYPSANWDKTSKFLYYHPHDVLLTSAEHDHVNVFPTHNEYLAPFKTLLSLIPPDGLLVASVDDESSLALFHTHTGRKVSYGTKNTEAEWSAENMKFGEHTKFTLVKNKQPIAELSTRLLGKHNIENIVGVSAFLLEKQLVTPEELAKGVEAFEGVERRLVLLSPNSTVRVYEGFGSSYEKARAGIEATKLHFPNSRLIIIFEPHTFSWRNRDALPWYDDVFKEADLVLVYEPATQGADTHKQLSQAEIVDRIQKTGVETKAIQNAKDALATLKTEVKSHDVVLLSTSGELGGLISEVPLFVEKTFPRNNAQSEFGKKR